MAAAVRLAGGPGAAATICGVSRQTIYDWINERRVERLIDALRLSRASCVAIENLTEAYNVERRPPKFKLHAQSAGENRKRFSGSLVHDVIDARSEGETKIAPPTARKGGE